MNHFMRGLGILLILIALLPGELLLSGADHGVRGSVMLDWSQAHRWIQIWGLLALAVLGALLGRVPGDDAIRPALARVGRAMAAVPSSRWALLLGIIAFVLAQGAQVFVYQNLLTNPDEMVSLVQARFMAAGQLGGEMPADPAFWLTINAVASRVGWVSQYPPGHLVVLALGVLVGAPLVVGPLASGLGVALYALAADRLLPDRRTAARLAMLLLALSPFVAILGGQILSHSTTFLAGALALYAALRARDGHWAWGIAAGAAGALMVAARPWTGLTVGPVLVLGPWLGALAPRQLLQRVLAVVAGGIPFGIGFLAYHAIAFGSPTELGYLVAFGPSHGLGFHPDPWGYVYSLTAALGYTSGDLAILGVQLFESPLSPLLVAGIWLTVAPGSVVAPAGFLLAWALVSIPANLLYWFHAPRMYLESAPALFLLTALAVTHTPAEVDASPSARARWLRGATTWVFLLAALSPLLLVGQRLSSLGWEEPTRARVSPPPGLPDGPSLVFVHTGWSNRIGRVLEAEGMRGDSTGILIGMRDPCELWLYALDRRSARLSGAPAPPSIPMVPGPPRSGPLPTECDRQLRADRFQTVALLPLIWQGDLPGLPAEGPMYVRDLGPEANEALLRTYPDRIPLLLRAAGPTAPPVLEPYREGMRLLWGEDGT